MPSAEPSSRAVSFIAEATPCLDGRQRLGHRSRGRRTGQTHAGGADQQSEGEEPGSRSTWDRMTTYRPDREQHQCRRGTSRRNPNRAARRGASRAVGISTNGIGSIRSAGLQRAQRDHELQVLQDREDQAEPAEERHRNGQAAHREAPGPRRAGVEQRVARAAAPSPRTRPAPRPRPSGRPGWSASAQPRSGPSMIPKTSSAHTDQGEHPADDVDRRRVLVDGVGHASQRADHRHRGEPDVEPEEGLPGEELQQDRGDEQTDDRAGRRRCPTQAPIARGRSSSGKEVVITDSVVGMTAAAPSPITARTAIKRGRGVDERAGDRRPTRRSTGPPAAAACGRTGRRAPRRRRAVRRRRRCRHR